MFVQVGHCMAAVLTCSTPFTSACWGDLTNRTRCVCVVCVCVVCARVCLGLLVILAWLFSGNKNEKREAGGSAEGARRRVTGLSDCLKSSSSFSLWLKETERRKKSVFFSLPGERFA